MATYHRGLNQPFVPPCPAVRRLCTRSQEVFLQARRLTALLCKTHSILTLFFTIFLAEK